MKSFNFVIFNFVLLLVSFTNVFGLFLRGNQIPTVSELDINRYLGHWYTMYVNKFDWVITDSIGKCMTADYSPSDDPEIISVYNRQINLLSGKIDDISGYAYVPDSSEPAQLKVGLDGVPTEGDYWVVDLQSDYEYSIVTDRRAQSLFVLARNPEHFYTYYDKEVRTKLDDFGFEYIRVNQLNCTYSNSMGLLPYVTFPKWHEPRKYDLTEEYNDLLASSITRDEIMTRAQKWVDEKVPYSTTYYTDGYRQDCSGYVSYSWASSTSNGGHTTSTMQDICTKITKSEMQKGDAILKPGTHVLLFGGWIDSDYFWEYAELHTGEVCTKSKSSYTHYTSNGYFPCKYNLAI